MELSQNPESHYSYDIVSVLRLIIRITTAYLQPSPHTVPKSDSDLINIISYILASGTTPVPIPEVSRWLLR